MALRFVFVFPGQCSVNCIQLSLFALLVKGQHGGLFFEIPHPVGVPELDIGLHDVVDGRVVAIEVLGDFSDGCTVLPVLVKNVNPLIVQNELLRVPRFGPI